MQKASSIKGNKTNCGEDPNESLHLTYYADLGSQIMKREIIFGDYAIQTAFAIFFANIIN